MKYRRKPNRERMVFFPTIYLFRGFLGPILQLLIAPGAPPNSFGKGALGTKKVENLCCCCFFRVKGAKNTNGWLKIFLFPYFYKMYMSYMMILYNFLLLPFLASIWNCVLPTKTDAGNMYRKLCSNMLMEEIRLTTWDEKNLVNNETIYQPQLVIAGFLNHQP